MSRLWMPLDLEVRGGGPVQSLSGEVAAGAHPSSGGHLVHLVGQAGALPPWTWTISAAGSLDPLPWAATTAVTRGVVRVLPNGAYALCTTGGTTGSTAPTNLGAGVPDGSAQWLIILTFSNGLLLVAASGSPTIGPQGGELLPLSVSAPLTMSSFSTPTSIYVASSGAFQLVVMGAP